MHIAQASPYPARELAVPGTSRALPPWARLGILFGLLGAASIALFGPIGVSGTYARALGAFWHAFTSPDTEVPAYLAKMGKFLTPESMLVIGLIIGGFLASRFGRAAREGYRAPPVEIVHANEATSTRRRYLNAFIGGVLILFGARLAGGCTSGHIISGMTQMSLSGMVFAAGVFATGMLTARSFRRGY